MSDLDRYLTDEHTPTTGQVMDAYVHINPEDASATPAAFDRWLSAVIRDAKAEALRELRDYLAEPLRVWFGDMGVRVALDIDDTRSHLALSAYLDLRADRIEQGGQP